MNEPWPTPPSGTGQAEPAMPDPPADGPAAGGGPPVLLGEGSVLRGRYRLVGLVAGGGMAQVWEAVDEVLTRAVAVKVLHGHLALDESVQERFRREAVAAARLAHPNVVATFDAGEDGGTSFIVMELVRGRNLRAVLTEEGPLPPAAVAAIGIQVADALAHSHEAGIIHRDVKPANVLVCDPEPGGTDPLPRVKVADFGIARAAMHDGTSLTAPGALIGTAKYLSPEQIGGRPPDARSDVYALGVVLYELVTGRAPFVGETEVATAIAHLHDQPLRPRQVRPGIPRSLEAIVWKAMARDPDARFQSAGELGQALRDLELGPDDAVPAVIRDPTPPSGVAPTFRQTERSWLLPAAAIVVVAAALVVLGVVFSRSEVGRTLLNREAPTTTGQTTVLPVASVRSFDPEGNDGVENEGRTAAVLDGDPTTTWSTVRYETREFGGLKPGVGLILELGQRAPVRRIRISSPTSGWDVAVHVAPQAERTLGAWGEAAAERTGVGGDVEVDLDDAEGGAVLIWITRLGEANRVEISEVVVER